VDTKLSKIESMNRNGANRITILQSENLRHPISLDIFESSIYWVTKETGELLKQDKFGRGVAVSIMKDLVNPTNVKIYHPLKYNSSLYNPCKSSDCSHLCLLIPNGGYRCACPEGSVFREKSLSACEAPFEREKPQPLTCPCSNGGTCKFEEVLTCQCPEDFVGQYCGEHVQRRRISNDTGVSPAAVAIPLVIIILLSLGAGAFYIFLKKRGDFIGKGLGSSVSFRQGSNVEFVSDPSSSAGSVSEHPESKIDMKTRDFSNPMFEAVEQQQSGSSTSPPPIAILPPSSVVQRSSPQIQIRQFEPSEDTGKDTQNLVDEFDC
jgi:low density lipoprotein-related protein 2